MARPTLRQLEYLIAVHQEKSFSKAALYCNVTQSTLSAGIKELEHLLDQQLVIRERGSTHLTGFGLEMIAPSQSILSAADKIVSRSKLLKEPLSGPLRLGVIPTIAPYILPEIMPKAVENFPRLELQLYEDLTDRLIEALKRNQIDLALMAFPYETPGITQQILFEEPFYAATTQHYAFGGKDSIAISELEPDILLLLEDGHCLRDHALSACELDSPQELKTFSATSLPTLIQMVRQGLGMTLLPEMATRPDTLPSGIELIPFTDKAPPTRQIGLCWKQGNPRRNDFEKLGDLIKKTS